jgi:hypothetical protein
MENMEKGQRVYLSHIWKKMCMIREEYITYLDSEIDGGFILVTYALFIENT